MDAEVWAAATGAHVATMKDHIAGIKDIECSPDEERAVSIGQNGVVHIWQLSTGVTLRKFGESYHDAFLVRFSTKGTRVLTLHSGPVNTDNGIRMWDAETAKLLWEADQGDQQIYSSGISKDGHYILTTSWDKTVTVVDTTTGHTTTLKGLTGPVYYATFSPDAKYVAGIGQDRTARVWNAASGETIAELRGSNVKLHSAEFSPDGKFIVTTSDDSVARIYPMKQFAPYDELLNMARQQYPEVQPSSDKPRNTKQD
jgi:WD40 repeat protein